jgi:hypothetical protein
MTKTINIVVTGVLMVALVACSKDDGANKPANDSPTQKKAEHAAADAVPGSHGDWCGEHAVAESQCTRCNSDLVAAFKATGDWCEEHGVPESHCLKCNPEIKIVRPPKASTEPQE